MKSLILTLLISLISISMLTVRAQWSTIPAVTTERLFAVHTLNSQEALIGGKDGVLFRTSNSGENWTTIAATDEDITDILFTDENTGYMVAGSLVFKSDDGGSTWLSTPTGVGDDLVAISFPTSQTGYACTEGGDVIKSTDAGASWTALNTGSTQELTGIAFGDANTGVVVGAAGTVLHTSDGGTSWQIVDAGTTEDLNDVCFTNATTAYLVGGQGILMQTVNGGADWSNQVSLTVSDLNAIDFYDENNGYAAGRDGVIVYTNNGGDLWNSETPITTERLLDIHFHDANHGYAVGREGVILQYSVATGITNSRAEKINVRISPNPVFETATITIDNRKNQPWQLEVIDLSGSLVMDLEGIARDEIRFSRDGLKSGMYIYSVKIAGHDAITGKFVVQ